MSIHAQFHDPPVFPAPAGVILLDPYDVVEKIGFPRTCGGDPWVDTDAKPATPFSPHLRG